MLQCSVALSVSFLRGIQAADNLQQTFPFWMTKGKKLGRGEARRAHAMVWILRLT